MCVCVSYSEFYDFEHIPNFSQFKNAYRNNIDSLKVSQLLADRLVEEANVAFELNMRLFIELDGKNPDEVIKQHREKEKAKEEARAKESPSPLVSGRSVVSQPPPNHPTVAKSSAAVCPFHKMLGLDKSKAEVSRPNDHDNNINHVPSTKTQTDAAENHSDCPMDGPLLIKLSFVVLILLVLCNLLS